MRAAVAAGHPATVDAGIEILEEGGNAADAAVAAALASCVAETVMTGLLGGGHAIVLGEELMTGMLAARGLVATLRHPQASKALREMPDWQLHLHRTEKRLRAFDGRLQQRLEAYQSGV